MRPHAHAAACSVRVVRRSRCVGEVAVGIEEVGVGEVGGVVVGGVGVHVEGCSCGDDWGMLAGEG